MEIISHLLGRLWHFYVDSFPALLYSVSIAAGLVVSVVMVELCLIGWHRSSLKRILMLSKSTQTDSTQTDVLAFLLVETTAGLFLGMAMFLGLTYFIQHEVRHSLSSLHLIDRMPGILAFGIFLVAVDFANYWTHRFCHSVPALWAMHRYHHSAPDMTVLNSARDHPMERAISSLLVITPMALLSTSVGNYGAVWILIKLVGLFKHSNFRSNWGYLGRYWIQSPGAHWVHHSQDSQHHNKNFASLFQFWDVLFGTAVHPTGVEVEKIRIGLLDDRGQAPPFSYIFQIFLDVWRCLLKKSR